MRAEQQRNRLISALREEHSKRLNLNLALNPEREPSGVHASFRQESESPP